jgi:light-harvesting complex 1 beta chain
VHRLLGIKEPA